MHLTYKLLIDPHIPFNPKLLKEFVQCVIHHKNGIKTLFNNKLKLTQVPNEAKSDITIILSSNNDIERICGFNLLSCADRLNGHIYLNWTRWDEGSDIFFNGLTSKYKRLSHTQKMNLYRTYVVNHEILHILGFDHPPSDTHFKGKSASVMAQQTINLQGGTSWWWPVKKDKIYFKQYSYTKYSF